MATVIECHRKTKLSDFRRRYDLLYFKIREKKQILINKNNQLSKHLSASD